MKNKTKAWLYEAPTMIVLILATLGGFYVKAIGNNQIGWAAPIVLLVITILFFIGKRYDNKGDSAFSVN